MDRSRALISVVLPVFNGGKYLPAAISSVLVQSFSNFEFIIINDGSVDDSGQIINKFAEQDHRIVVVERENRGLVSSLNEGISKASCDLIARMDADDICMPDRLERQLDFMNAHPEVCLLGSAYTLIDENSLVICAVKPETENSKLQDLALQCSTPVCHPTAVFRRSAFMSVGGYREAAMLAEDLDLWLRLGEIGQIRNLPDVLVKYRQHASSLSEMKQEKQLLTMVSVVKDAYKRRNLGEPDLPILAPWRSVGTSESNYKQIICYGWWAWTSGNIHTARVYAFKALRLKPVDISSWKLGYCALFRTPSNNHSK